jgi:hypothetical protein
MARLMMLKIVYANADFLLNGKTTSYFYILLPFILYFIVKI